MLDTDVMNLDFHAGDALGMVEPSVNHAVKFLANRKAFHLVILDPRVPYQRGLLLPVLKEFTFGEQDASQWKLDFRDLARRKANLCWRTGRSCRDVAENAPWLYEVGDTKYPGGIIFNGLIVAGSGFSWQYDESFSYATAGLMWSRMELTRDAIMHDEGKVIL